MRRERPVLRLLVVLVTVGVALATPAVAAGPAPTPPWMSHDGARFGLATTGAWDVHGEHVKARVLKVSFAPSPKANEAADRQGVMDVWSPTCLSGVQTIRLRRTVKVPGPLGRVSAAIAPQVAAGFSLTSMEILVNGQPLLKTTGRNGGGLEPTRAEGSLFKFGQNTIELVATKAKNPAGVAKCNVSASTKVAVYAVVRGEIETDLALIEPAPSNKAFNFRGVKNIVGEASFTVRNKGRGGASRGSFYLRAVVPPGELRHIIVEPPVGGPFEKCQTTEEGADVYQTVCYFHDFRPGASHVIHVRYGSGNSKIGKNVSVDFQWRLNLAGVETDPSNNERTAKVWFCEFAIGSDGKSCNSS